MNLETALTKKGMIYVLPEESETNRKNQMLRRTELQIMEMSRDAKFAVLRLAEMPSNFSSSSRCRWRWDGVAAAACW
jgi:hypothetical protein